MSNSISCSFSPVRDSRRESLASVNSTSGDEVLLDARQTKFVQSLLSLKVSDNRCLDLAALFSDVECNKMHLIGGTASNILLNSYDAINDIDFRGTVTVRNANPYIVKDRVEIALAKQGICQFHNFVARFEQDHKSGFVFITVPTSLGSVDIRFDWKVEEQSAGKKSGPNLFNQNRGLEESCESKDGVENSPWVQNETSQTNRTISPIPSCIGSARCFRIDVMPLVDPERDPILHVEAVDGYDLQKSLTYLANNRFYIQEDSSFLYREGLRTYNRLGLSGLKDINGFVSQQEFFKLWKMDYQKTGMKGFFSEKNLEKFLHDHHPDLVSKVIYLTNLRSIFANQDPTLIEEFDLCASVLIKNKHAVECADFGLFSALVFWAEVPGNLHNFRMDDLNGVYPSFVHFPVQFRKAGSSPWILTTPPWDQTLDLLREPELKKRIQPLLPLLKMYGIAPSETVQEEVAKLLSELSSHFAEAHYILLSDDPKNIQQFISTFSDSISPVKHKCLRTLALGSKKLAEVCKKMSTQSEILTKSLTTNVSKNNIESLAFLLSILSQESTPKQWKTASLNQVIKILWSESAEDASQIILSILDFCSQEELERLFPLIEKVMSSNKGEALFKVLCERLLKEGQFELFIKYAITKSSSTEIIQAALDRMKDIGRACKLYDIASDKRISLHFGQLSKRFDKFKKRDPSEDSISEVMEIFKRTGNQWPIDRKISFLRRLNSFPSRRREVLSILLQRPVRISEEGIEKLIEFSSAPLPFYKYLWKQSDMSAVQEILFLGGILFPQSISCDIGGCSTLGEIAKKLIEKAPNSQDLRQSVLESALPLNGKANIDLLEPILPYLSLDELDKYINVFLNSLHLEKKLDVCSELKPLFNCLLRAKKVTSSSATQIMYTKDPKLRKMGEVLLSLPEINITGSYDKLIPDYRDRYKKHFSSQGIREIENAIEKTLDKWFLIKTIEDVIWNVDALVKSICLIDKKNVLLMQHSKVNRFSSEDVLWKQLFDIIDIALNYLPKGVAQSFMKAFEYQITVLIKSSETIAKEYLKFQEKLKQSTFSQNQENAFFNADDPGYWYQSTDISAILAAKSVSQFFEKNNVQVNQPMDYKRFESRVDEILDSVEKGTPSVCIYNVGGLHWVSFLVYKHENTIVVLYKDSKGNSNDELEKLFKSKCPSLRFIFDATDDQRDDSSHCGIMALRNSVNLVGLNRDFIPSRKGGLKGVQFCSLKDAENARRLELPRLYFEGLSNMRAEEEVRGKLLEETRESLSRELDNLADSLKAAAPNCSILTLKGDQQVSKVEWDLMKSTIVVDLAIDGFDPLGASSFHFRCKATSDIGLASLEKTINGLGLNYNIEGDVVKVYFNSGAKLLGEEKKD